jgi:hypothetical protein
MGPPRETARSLDRFDVLILLIATTLGMLAAAAASALEPPAVIGFPTPPTRLPGPQLPAPILVPAPGPSPTAPSSPAILISTPAPSLPGPLVPSLPVAPTDEPAVLAPWNPSKSALTQAIEVSRPYLAAWTLAFPILRFRRPRPPKRLLTRQPGIAACGIAGLVLAVQLAAILLRWALSWSWTALSLWLPPSVWPFGASIAETSPLLDLWQSIHVGFLESSCAAHGIAGAWLIMALGGWWRPERTAIDRLGRALGAGWITVMVAGLIEGCGPFYH